MKLSDEEIERYARQIILRGVGGPGQQKLKAARVLVVGAGGLGSPALQYLAAAGVGEIAVVDDDIVSLSNLHRQILHGTPDLDRPKIDSAADALHRLNPNVVVERRAMRIDAANAREIVRGYDVVLDGSDNFATRYAVSDACFHERVTLVTAALGQYDATLTTLSRTRRRPTGRRTRPIAACSPRPRRRARSRLARRRACSARLPAWSGR